MPIRAGGALLGVVAFARTRRPETFTADDLIHAEELTAKAAAAIDNARRYTREPATALTLQRSLLPRRLPHQQAVEAASAYLPAEASSGVGAHLLPLTTAPTTPPGCSRAPAR